MKAQRGRPIAELLGSSNVTRDGSHIEINNAETYELVRRKCDVHIEHKNPPVIDERFTHNQPQFVYPAKAALIT